MKIVEAANQRPSVCFICERTDGPFVDTRRTFDAGGKCRLNGRRYICKSCTISGAKLFGWSAPEEIAEANARIEAETARADAAEERAAAFESISEALDVLKPKKAARGAAKKAAS